MRLKIRLTIDILLLMGMFFSMSLHLFGMGPHKLIGLFTFVLFIVHNRLNKVWYKALRRGTYRRPRIVRTVTNFMMLFGMIGIVVSGVMLSGDVADGFGETMTAGRVLHNGSSYVTCIGIALHIGFHLRRNVNHDD